MRVKLQMLRRLTAIGVFATATMLATSGAHAATALMIWPIDPVIESNQRATAIWLENRDAAPVTLQTRVVGWSQVDGTETFDPDQSEIAISPPLVTVQPGERQLIRLIRLGGTATRSESAYRIFIDELPRSNREDAGEGGQVSMGIQFQMHYSLPLFSYGAGLRSKAASGAQGQAIDVGAANLSWNSQTDEGEQWVVLMNRGPVHARLTSLSFISGGERVDSDLLGYVLPGASMRWKLPAGVANASDLHVLATVNGTTDTSVEPHLKP